MNSQAVAAQVPWATLSTGQDRSGLMVSAIPSAGWVLGVLPSWQSHVCHLLSDEPQKILVPVADSIKSFPLCKGQPGLHKKEPLNVF